MGHRHEVRVPKLGDMAEEVFILEWLCSVGDRMEEGDPLVRVETDKVETEIPAPVSGTITELRAEPEEEVAVGEVICTIETG